MAVLELITYVRYSSVQVIFCGTSKHNLFKQHLGKLNLTSRMCRAYGTISYEIYRKIPPFKINGVDVTRSHSRYFRTHNLHFRVRFFARFHLYLYFLPIKKLKNFFTLKKMICTLLLSDKKYRSPCSFKRKKNIYFVIELSLREIYFVMFLRVLICAR